MSAQAAVELAVKGYGLRWKIEEVHRQIKVDYHQEEIRLARLYEKITFPQAERQMFLPPTDRALAAGART